MNKVSYFKIHFIILSIIFALGYVLFAQNTNELQIEAKVYALLSKMTLEEKIGQMNQRHVGADLSRWDEDVEAGLIGSFLNAGDWKTKNRLQKIAVKKSRLGVPLIFGRDVIHGYRTMLPIPLAMASSFNPDLLEEGSRMAAREASADGQHWTFAPMIDITRDPRWGRIAETLGEDPYLTSMLGAACVRGFQGNLSDPQTIAACAKHYVGYGAAEGGRDYNSTQISERELRGVYLPPFKAAVDANVLTLMSAFHDINGIPATGHPLILNQILRNEWHFNGFVISDWDAVGEMIDHGFCKDSLEAAYKAVTAGIDMEMVSTTFQDKLAGLVQRGVVSEDLINERVANILRVKFKLGLFDRPFNNGKQRKILLCDDHLKIAKEAAIQSTVLLKNDNNVLPLSKTRKVAVIGPLANAPRDQMGMWTVDGREEDVITPLTAIRDQLGESNVLYVQGLKTSRDTSSTEFQKAVQAAQNSDAVIMFVGEESILSGEARCRAFLHLPGVQSELVHAVAKTGKPLVLVMMAGRTLTFEKEARLADGILWAWHNGTMGGPALADILFGKASPSGKLPVTFPRTVGQIPIYYAHRNTGRPPTVNEVSIPTGTPLNPQDFSSNYLDVEWTPAYPFGYGLSYTSFEYSNLNLSSDNYTMDDTVTISADIMNTGKVNGTEIVQLYIRDPFASVARPVRELKGFQRITLQPGEKKKVQFDLPVSGCGFYGMDNRYTVEPGLMHVWVAPNAASGLQGKFNLVKTEK